MKANLGDELQRLAKDAAKRLEGRVDERLRPRLTQLLQDQAMTFARKAAGEDVTTAEIALESSFLSVAREERAVIQAEAKELALQALATVLRVAIGAAMLA